MAMAKGAGKGQKKGPSKVPKPGSKPAESAAQAPVLPYTQADIIMHSLEIIERYSRGLVHTALTCSLWTTFGGGFPKGGSLVKDR